MSESLNLTSLKMVQDELVATIERAAGRLDQFSRDPSDGKLLQGCIEDIKQISGTLNLIQLRGVDLLAQELVDHITDITLGDADTGRKLQHVTGAFFVLPRYLEYCTQTSRSMAVLLIPHINELRLARRQPALPESHFADIRHTAIKREISTGPGLQEELAVLVRRLRHMYQVAMLNVLQGKQIKPSLGMMGRAMQRLDQACQGAPLSNLWWSAAAFLATLEEEKLALTKGRKLLLSALDREIKRLQFGGDSGLNREPPEELLKELFYLIALSRSEHPRAKAVMQAAGLSPLPYTDADLAREQAHLSGPSVNTLMSMAAELKDELRGIKNILERASEGGVEMLNDSPELLETLKRVADILSLVGLVSPSNSLKEEIAKIASWSGQSEPVDANELLAVADTLLYIESTVAGLGKIKLSDDKLTQINSLSRHDAIATSHLAEAAQLVIEEAESGLGLVKRALSAFAESNYDVGHIKNVTSTLGTVRGGMIVLNLPRAAAVVQGCARFVDEQLLQNQQPAAVQHMLETFADAIISLEYYLDSIKLDQKADDSVLQVAEESLDALGYSSSH